MYYRYPYSLHIDSHPLLPGEIRTKIFCATNSSAKLLQLQCQTKIERVK